LEHQIYDNIKSSNSDTYYYYIFRCRVGLRSSAGPIIGITSTSIAIDLLQTALSLQRRDCLISIPLDLARRWRHSSPVVAPGPFGRSCCSNWTPGMVSKCNGWGGPASGVWVRKEPQRLGVICRGSLATHYQSRMRAPWNGSV